MELVKDAAATANLPVWGTSIEVTAHKLTMLGDQLLAAQAQLKNELRIVGDIQQSMLPDTLPYIPGFDIATHYQPCAMAGGDYYDIVPLAGDVWGLVIADVAGHGVSATVIMAVMRALVHAHLPLTTRYMSSKKFLEFMNQQLTAYTVDGRFVTVWCAVLAPETRELTYASAGHNPPRLVRRGIVTALNGVNGLPLGIDETATYEEVTVALEPGDLLVAYTDGFTEAMRKKGGQREYFGTDRLDQILTEIYDSRADECVKRVTTAVTSFTNTSVPTDDQTLMVVAVDKEMV